MVRREIFKIG